MFTSQRVLSKMERNSHFFQRVSDLGASDLGVNDLGVNDLGVNDLGVNDLTDHSFYWNRRRIERSCQSLLFKGMISFIIVILTLFHFNQWELQGEEKKMITPPSGYYTKHILKDPSSGVPVLEAVVPENWTVNCVVNWNNVSTLFPGVAQVTILSEDGNTGMIWCSGRNYIETTAGGFVFHQDGIDYKTYTTKLRYRRADAMSDFYLGNIFGLSMFNFIKEFDPPIPARNAINQMLGIYSSSLQQKLSPAFASGGAQYVQTGQEATLANRQYEVLLPNGERHYAETACAVLGVSESVLSNTGTISFNEWICPYMIFYSGKTKEFFERDYAVYRFIMDNMKARDEFTFVNNKYGSEIQNAVFNRLTQENIAMTQAKAAAMMKDRSTSSSPAPKESSGFDWGKEWGDYIYDRNTFRTEEGGTIQASTSFDGVWQSGNRFYAGSAGNAPSGWQQLSLNR